MVALCEVHLSPSHKAFHQRLVATHKPRKLALVTGMRKLSRLLNALPYCSTGSRGATLWYCAAIGQFKTCTYCCWL